MNKYITLYLCFVLSGLMLSITSTSVSAKHVGPEAGSKGQVTAELCNEVNRYDDWKLFHDQWVSETFDYQRYEWKAGKGYPVKESKFYEITDYDKYSTEILVRLAQEGDKAANLELAQRHYYFYSNSTPQTERFCYMAVVDGFSAMTSCMISSYGEKVVKQMAKDQGKPSDKQFKLRLGLLGWIEFSKNLDDIFVQRFAEMLEPGYQRDDINQAMIESSAQAIREAINKERKARKVYKETVTVDVDKEMPALWRYLEQNKLEEQVIHGCLQASSPEDGQENQYAKQ